MKKISLILILFLITSNYIFAQLQASPTVIFIDQHSRSGEIELTNKSDKHLEVNLEFQFGYLCYDSAGRAFVNYDDAEAAGKFSIAENVKCYPKKCIIPPEETQIVRFILRGVNKLPDGTYWTRVFVKSKELETQIDSSNVDNENIGARFIINVKTTLMMVYQKGNVNTELEVVKDDISVSENIDLSLHFKRGGNSPFWGTILINVFDENDDIVDMIRTTLPVYFNSMRVFTFPKSKYKPGKYHLIYKITNEHNDIDESLRLDFSPIEKRIDFEVN